MPIGLKKLMIDELSQTSLLEYTVKQKKLEILVCVMEIYHWLIMYKYINSYLRIYVFDELLKTMEEPVIKIKRPVLYRNVDFCSVHFIFSLCYKTP